MKDIELFVELSSEEAIAINGGSPLCLFYLPWGIKYSFQCSIDTVGLPPKSGPPVKQPDSPPIGGGQTEFFF